MAVFAKFDGVDGESVESNADEWIDVLATDWGMARQGSFQPAEGSDLMRSVSR